MDVSSWHSVKQLSLDSLSLHDLAPRDQQNIVSAKVIEAVLRSKFWSSMFVKIRNKFPWLLTRTTSSLKKSRADHVLSNNHGNSFLFALNCPDPGWIVNLTENKCRTYLLKSISIKQLFNISAVCNVGIVDICSRNSQIGLNWETCTPCVIPCKRKNGWHRKPVPRQLFWYILSAAMFPIFPFLLRCRTQAHLTDNYLLREANLLRIQDHF